VTTATAEITQLIPGYTTTERLGSGGYGEVWRAEAPGGFQKAIKVVYGFHDDERAKRELKALEHIKCVRHPFLLSVERAEIVDGRLAILMELADESLDQRFDECREQGLPGIPRDELLGYMHDAADALDFLFKRHALQHLDIKPENLLLVAGHIKVADFGLVKDVTERSQFSMVGGMTPTYAAPELFDGRPSRHSDQYSLAIVYQEMLTGALPFPGRTSAQLALQHTQGRPMLTSLPVQDREIVAKALSKTPNDRFGSCLEFIDTLRGDRAAQSQSSRGKDQGGTSSDQAQLEETKSISSGATECLSNDGSVGKDGERKKRPSSQKIQRTEAIDGDRVSSQSRPLKELREGDQLLRVSSRIVEASMPQDVPKTATFRPTLYIGIGGLGARILARFRKELFRQRDVDWPQVFPILVFDTDRIELQTAESGAFGGALSKYETCHLPLRRPHHYRSESSELLQWLSRRWLYNIPRTLQTRGFRPLGRLALVDHAERVHELLEERLRPLYDRRLVEGFASQAEIPCRAPTPRVVLVASTNGGTGGGMMVDVAYAVRSCLERLAVELAGTGTSKRVEIMGLATHATRRREEENALSVANAYSWLSEMATIDRCGYRGSRAPDEQSARFEGDRFPFDDLYFVHLGDDLSDQECEDVLGDLAEYVACDAVTTLGAALEKCRQTKEAPSQPRNDVALRTFTLARQSPTGEKTGNEGGGLETAAVKDPADVAVLPLGCGHTRRLIAVAPGDQLSSDAVKSIRRAVPGGDVVAAEVPMPFVLCEAEGLSLAHVAAKLVESRPDAAEAAHRLHTRNDIEWQRLPNVLVDDDHVDGPIQRPAAAAAVDTATEVSSPAQGQVGPRRLPPAKTEEQPRPADQSKHAVTERCDNNISAEPAVTEPKLPDLHAYKGTDVILQR
jgi:serine/threonine protein kinase